MKVKIEIDERQEPLIIIKCNAVTDEIKNLKAYLEKQDKIGYGISFYQDDRECYFPIDNVLFFETEGSFVYAHTANEVYRVKLRLYELEQKLPASFLRISKSTIVNSKQIYAIEHNITSYSLVQFYKSHKQVYVSRMYYHALKHKLQERRL